MSSMLFNYLGKIKWELGTKPETHEEGLTSPNFLYLYLVNLSTPFTDNRMQYSFLKHDSYRKERNSVLDA